MKDLLVVKKTDGSTFYKYLNKAISEIKYSGYLTEYTKEDLSNMDTLILLEEGKAGVAITKDRTIVSLYNNSKNREISNVVDLLIPVAITFGGVQLDCFGEYLTQKYMRNGFLPIAKAKFVDACAPINWNFERDGRPDIYFLIKYTPDNFKLVSEKNSYNDISLEEIKEELPYIDYNEWKTYASDFMSMISSNDYSYADLIKILNGAKIRRI